MTADVDAVYTFEHAALRTIQAAREKGVFSFYEQPSQHHAFFGKVLREQLSRYPELANAHTGILLDSKTVRRNRRRDEELLLADCVLCNSQFTRRTLTDAGVDGRKIEVTPIGFPRPLPSSREATGGPVIFLNAGIQSLRKGVHLLYRAWRSLSFREDEAELWLVGKMELPESLRRDLPGRVRITESMPRKDLMQLYGHASVLVLPSLADGFGMVVTEAMSRGLPAIVTTDTGTSDVITHGNSGFVIPPGDEAALAAQMRWCVEHREELPAMGAAALATAEQWQWADYRRALASLISRKLRERSELVGGREAPGRGAANARPNHAAAGGSEIGH
ncbi:MAG TPA: glycosyltransferase family 4 protein [Acidobacteriaceae bacterium]|nr:glycosyltransferase family 4 protein [Acidobacteriaceae bacterium]